jgi:hypothetical protein
MLFLISCFSVNFSIKFDCIRCTEEFCSTVEALGKSGDDRGVRLHIQSGYAAALSCTNDLLQVWWHHWLAFSVAQLNHEYENYGPLAECDRQSILSGLKSCCKNVPIICFSFISKFFAN